MNRRLLLAAAASLALLGPSVRAQAPAPSPPASVASLPLNVQPSPTSADRERVVFSSKTFPVLDYAVRSDAEKIIGPYTLATRYFTADHKEVREANKSGRYGTIVEVRDASGTVRDTWFLTLYRLPQHHTDIILDGPRTPAALLAARLQAHGISRAQIAAQPSSFADYLKIDRPPQSWLSYAVLLAGLNETRPGDLPVQRLAVQERDRRWWYEQKKQLGLVANYRHIVELPPGYNQNHDKYPVLLFLHGSGERGTNVEQVRVHGPLRLIREGKTLPFIVVAPQCDPGDRWLPERVIALLDEIEKTYRVDKQRVYLTGLSMGGYGTWATALEYPDRFAALLPICGGGDPKDAARIARIPVWDFHGGKDPTVPVARSQEMVDALRATGDPEVYFKIYPDAGHDSWTETYNNPDIYPWLLQHKR